MTPQDIRASFDEVTFARGLEYARRGRVIEVRTAPAGTSITASVRGNVPVPYEVTLHVRSTPRGRRIEAFCDCPVEFNCKHAAAAALTAADARGEPGDPVVSQWLAELDAYQAPGDSAASGPHVRYVIGLGRTQFVTRLELSTSIHAALKAGGLSAGRKVDLANAFNSEAPYVLPTDRTIARLATGAGLIGYGLSNPSRKMLAYFLELAVETGRLHWNSVQTSALGKDPIEGAIGWNLDADGRQHACVSSMPSLLLLPSNPVWYVDPERALTGPIELGIDPDLASLIASAPALTPNQARRVQATWHRVFAGVNVAAPTTDVETQIVERNPVPMLRLMRFAAPPGTPAAREPLEAIADLRFGYGDATVAMSDERREFQEVVGNRLTIWPRMRGFEHACADSLSQQGLTPIGWPHLQYVDRSATIVRFPGNSAHRWAPFLDVVVPRLKADGWRVEIDPDFPYAVLDSERWDAEVLESANHWFELDLGIDVEGERVALLPIIVDALRAGGIRSGGELAERSDDERIYGRLPNGRFVALAPRRVEQIVGTLVELFDVPLTKEGRLALTPGHVGAIEAIEPVAPLRWNAAQPLRAMIRELAGDRAPDSVVLPSAFKGELRPYQLEGVAWLQLLCRSGFGGVLADDMGLGKTVQLLAHVAIEKAANRLAKPVLIVAPTSVIPNWLAEIERFVPHLRVTAITGADRSERFADISTSDVALTTYALLHRDQAELCRHTWQMVVLDEAQNVKNPRSKAAQVAAKLSAQHRLALTGTPMENHLEELWSVFSFAVPGLLGDRTAFGRIFRTPIEKRGDARRRSLLAARLRPFLLRRTKENVLRDLPEKTEIVTRIELNGAQRDLYETIRLAMHERVRAELKRRGLARSRIVVLDALLKLRQVCCDPRLVATPAARKVNQSQKLEALLEMLPELVDEGRRILLFSQFTSMLDLIKPELAALGIDFVELRGATRDRVTPVRRFQSGEVPLFLISLKAGGTGLNLTAADTVIHYDPWWNPAVERQATDRAHRIGQHRPVFVYNLVTLGTVEERIRELAERKGELAAGLFGEAASRVLDPDEIDHLFAPL